MSICTHRYLQAYRRVKELEQRLREAEANCTQSPAVAALKEELARALSVLVQAGDCSE
jgi:hypothetical protein